MKVTIQIELDETWDEYKNMSCELFLDDLFSTWEKDGVKDVQLLKITV